MIFHRIPIMFHEDQCISRSQIQAKPTNCTYNSLVNSQEIKTKLTKSSRTICREKENIDSRIRIERFHNIKTFQLIYRAIQPQICDTVLNQDLELLR